MNTEVKTEVKEEMGKPAKKDEYVTIQEVSKSELEVVKAVSTQMQGFKEVKMS